MGQLIDGKWSDQWYDTKKSGGKFVRSNAGFRNWITPDGSPGPSGEGGFPAEAGRYHLYVSLACPWAHRTLILRKLKELDDLISVSVVSPKMPDETGWSFNKASGSTGDALFGKDFLWQSPARLYRPRHRSGALGQEDRQDRFQRKLRNHPHVQLGL
jgi:putative glutathione S-transferase